MYVSSAANHYEQPAATPHEYTDVSSIQVPVSRDGYEGLEGHREVGHTGYVQLDMSRYHRQQPADGYLTIVA